MKLKDKNAIVTGAASGIGRTVAIRMAEEGAGVVVNDINGQGAETVAEQIRAKKGNAIPIKADVTKIEEIKRMIVTTLEHFGKIDILVNNAGGGPAAPFNEISIEDLHFMLDLNLKSAVDCTRSVIEHMIERKSGNIINIASICGITGAAGMVPYSAAKAGIIGFTKALAKEVATHGIRVNSVSPGAIITPATEALPGHIEVMKKYMYLSRMGQPEDIANQVVFLLSEEGSFIVGQNIVVDGGRSLGW